MLAEPNGLRLSIKEADHSMLPVPYMVINRLPKDRRSMVIRIEIHVECINGPTTVVVDDDTAVFAMLEGPLARRRKQYRTNYLRSLKSREMFIAQKDNE